MTYQGEDSQTMWFANWHSENVYQFIRSESVYTEQTEVQQLEVIETDAYGRVLLQDGELQIATDADAAVHEAMVHPALLTHNDPTDILIIGGGDGGSTREALKYNPSRVDLVEIDERVIEVSKEYFPRFAADLEDDRVNIHILDGRQFVRQTNRTYDAVIMDISDPQGPAKTVFTVGFYDEVTDIMTEDGILHTHCESPNVTGNDFYRILSTLEEHFEKVYPYRHWVPAYVDFWGRAIASNAYSPYDISIEDVSSRIEEHNLTLEWLTPELFHAMFHSLNKQVREKMTEDWLPLTDNNDLRFEES